MSNQYSYITDAPEQAVAPREVSTSFHLNETWDYSDALVLCSDLLCGWVLAGCNPKQVSTLAIICDSDESWFHDVINHPDEAPTSFIWDDIIVSSEGHYAGADFDAVYDLRKALEARLEAVTIARMNKAASNVVAFPARVMEVA